MNADERKHLETNTLAEGISSLVERAKSGQIWNRWTYRIIVLTVAAVLIGGLSWYLLHEGKKTTSRQWMELAQPTQDDLEAIAKSGKDTITTKIARLEQARALLGPEGLAVLPVRLSSQRNKGIANIQKARDEFTKLADELKGDKTLRVTCLQLAAEAELSLVGIPKDANSRDSLGTVKQAADLYDQAAKVVGESTKLGLEYTVKAKQLLADETILSNAGKVLNESLMVAPSFDGFPKNDAIKLPTIIEPNKDAPLPTPIIPPTPPVITPQPVVPPTPTPAPAPTTPPTPKG